MRNKTVLRYMLPFLLTVVFFSSCSEGLFNFTEETGNISIGFFADSSVGSELKKVVFSLSNNETGDTLKKDCSIEYSGSGQTADCYISRVDTGHWQMKAAVYDKSGSIIADRSDDFEIELGQTVIADFSLYGGGAFDLDWETPVGSEPVSLLELKSLNTMINVYHYAGIPLSEAQKAVFMIAGGANFDTALSSLRVEFPDNGYFEYDGGFSRSINNIGIEAEPTILSVNRPGYTAKGNYSLTVSDVNGVQTAISDYCSFNFEPDYGAASITPAYAGAAVLNEGIDYDINDSSDAGCYLVYCVDETDGTNVGGTPIVYSPGSVTLDLTGSFLSNPIQGYVIIVSLDAYLNQSDIDEKYIATETNLSPDKLPGWLYLSFGDRINFIGISMSGLINF